MGGLPSQVDSLCGARGDSGESEAARRIKTEFLVQMQGVSSTTDPPDKRVLVLAATNTPHSLDQALRRRFDRRIYIPLPDASARRQMIHLHLGKDTPHTLTNEDLDRIAAETERFSGSDMAVLVKDVLFQPVRKTQEATAFRAVEGGLYEPCSPGEPDAFEATLASFVEIGSALKVVPPFVTRMDFEFALMRARPTVSEADLACFERFTEEFGEDG